MLNRVVYDLSNTPYVDIAGARMLGRLHDELAGMEIGFRVVGAHSDVRDRLAGTEVLLVSISVDPFGVKG